MTGLDGQVYLHSRNVRRLQHKGGYADGHNVKIPDVTNLLNKFSHYVTSENKKSQLLGSRVLGEWSPFL